MPLFFLPLEPLSPNWDKHFLFLFILIVILLVQIVYLLVQKNPKFSSAVYDKYLIFLSLLYLISTVLFTSNKIGSFTIPFSTGTVVAGTIFYLLLNQYKFSLLPLMVSGTILDLISMGTIAKIIPPANFPSDYLSTSALLFVFSVFLGTELVKSAGKSTKIMTSPLHLIKILLFIINFTLAILIFINLLITKQTLLLPLQLNWMVMLEAYKNFQNFLLGAGPSNYQYVFTMLKSPSINNTSFWYQTPVFLSSNFLVIAAEAGFLAVLVLTTLTAAVMKEMRIRFNPYQIPLLATLILLLFIPQNYLIFFTFILLLSVSSVKTSSKEINIYRDKIPLYTILIVSLLSLFSLIWLGRTVSSDIFRRLALKEANNQKFDRANDLVTQAIGLDPYSEDNYSLLSDLNQYSAANFLKAHTASESAQSKEYTDSLSRSIFFSKKALEINPINSSYWDRLLNLYAALPDDFQGKIESVNETLNRQSVLDPTNPLVKLNSAAIFMRYRQYPQAEAAINQAIDLKSDLGSAYYLLATLYSQTGNLPQSLDALTKTINLTATDSQDYQKLLSEYNNLKKFIDSEASRSAKLKKN